MVQSRELIAIRTLLYAMPKVAPERSSGPAHNVVHYLFRMRLRGGEYAVADRLTWLEHVAAIDER